MTSLLPTLVPSELPCGSPSIGTEISRLPTQVNQKDPPDKTIPDPSSTPGLILSATPNVIPKKSSSEPCLVSTSVPYETPSGPPSPGLIP